MFTNINEQVYHTAEKLDNEHTNLTKKQTI